MFSIAVIFTVATPAIPTGDYYSEKKEFNHVNSRNQSFYYNCLFAVANSTDQHLFAENRKQMLKDLQNETLQIDIGWVSKQIWALFPFHIYWLLWKLAYGLIMSWQIYFVSIINLVKSHVNPLSWC